MPSTRLAAEPALLAVPPAALPRGVHVLRAPDGRGWDVLVVTSAGELATPPMGLEPGMSYRVVQQAGRMLLDQVDPNPRHLALVH